MEEDPDLDEDAPAGAGWELDDLDDEEKDPDEEGEEGVEVADNGEPQGEWEIDDLGIEDDIEDTAGPDGSTFYFPNPGRSIAQQWASSSQLAVDHIAAGAFDSAISLLRRQCGIASFEPVKSHFMSLYMGATGSVPVMPLLPAPSHYLSRPDPENKRPNALPALCTSLEALADRLKVAYKATTDGRFLEAQQHFRHILHSIIFVVVKDKAAVAELKELLNISRDYTAALRLELTRKESTVPQQQLELAVFFTHCNLQNAHLALTLGAAMSAHFKAKNYGTASSTAKRLLEINSTTKAAQQARKVIQVAEQNGNTNAHKLDYDDKNPFVVCPHSLKPLYRGKEQIRCSYCYQPSSPKFRGEICPVCQLGTTGGDATGMVNCLEQVR